MSLGATLAFLAIGLPVLMLIVSVLTGIWPPLDVWIVGSVCGLTCGYIGWDSCRTFGRARD